MISKELLSNILDREVISVGVNRNNTWYDFKYGGGKINTYALAHKCKEWAFELGYMVRTNYENTIDVKVCRVTLSKLYKFKENGNCFYSTCTTTEPEAIFKACEWILEKQRDG